MIKEAKAIDAVAVFSGTLEHLKHEKRCMERGWHVVSAVPASHTLEEAHALKDITKRRGLNHMMAETSYPTKLTKRSKGSSHLIVGFNAFPGLAHQAGVN